MTFLSFAFSSIYLILVWKFSSKEKLSFYKFIAHFFAVIIATPALWQAILNGYSQDSFFTLNLFGNAGIIIISTVLISLFYKILFIKSQYLSRKTMLRADLLILTSLIDCILSLMLFVFLHSLSSQIYYGFYQMLIPDLPNQLVIKSILSFERIQSLMIISQDGSLSNHLSSLCLLAISPFTFWVYYSSKPNLIIYFLTLALLSINLPLILS